MNLYTKMIMDLLGLDSQTAIRVQDTMQIDFSECTKRQFYREARLAYEVLKEVDLYKSLQLNTVCCRKQA